MGKRRFYTPAEVAQHCAPRDCWVSVFGSVFDLTPLLREHQTLLADPIIAAAGTDISHWFDQETQDVRRYVEPSTNLSTPYCPQGRFLHVPPAHPAADWDSSFALPWWRDAARYSVGALSSGTRALRIKNVLTDDESIVEAPREETVADLRDRYRAINSHANSYVWKALRCNPHTKQVAFEELDLAQTLDENGVHDDAADLAAAGQPPEADCMPVLHLYFADDLTHEQ